MILPHGPVFNQLKSASITNQYDTAQLLDQYTLSLDRGASPPHDGGGAARSATGDSSKGQGGEDEVDARAVDDSIEDRHLQEVKILNFHFTSFYTRLTTFNPFFDQRDGL